MRRIGPIGFSLVLLVPALARADEFPNTGTLAEGTRWETPFFVAEGPSPGPTVVLTGGLHGNEPAGARAAEQIRHWPLETGRLIVLPRVNQPGLAARTRFLPDVEKPLRDLNRNFPKSDGPDTGRGELASAVWDFVQRCKPDWVIDLHEGYHFHQINEKSVGSSIIDSGAEVNAEVIPKMLEAVNATIDTDDKRFVLLQGMSNGTLARSARERLGAGSLILETTFREQPLSKRTRQHRLMVHAFLVELGMVLPATPTMTRPRVDEGTLRVALYDAGGVGGNGPRNIERTMTEIPRNLTWRVGPDDIREGALAHFDVVVFPGGSGSKQAAALEEAGREDVRTFVGNGGGFVGICAGAYLSAANYQWSLAISNHQTFREMHEIPGEGRKSMWFRGPSANVTMELTEEGQGILGRREGAFAVRYHNGPIVSPAGQDSLPDYRVLAHFRSEVSNYDPQVGTMVDTPAVIAAEFGEGRVLSISPHPESSESLRPMVANGIRWAAGQ